MVWGKKDSNGSVTVAYLLERQVALSWQEAVAIGLEAAEMTERSGRGAVPAYQNIELKSGVAHSLLRSMPARSRHQSPSPAQRTRARAGSRRSGR